MSRADFSRASVGLGGSLAFRATQLDLLGTVQSEAGDGSVGSVRHDTSGALTDLASPRYVVSAETMTGTTRPVAHWLGH